MCDEKVALADVGDRTSFLANFDPFGTKRCRELHCAVGPPPPKSFDGVVGECFRPCESWFEHVLGFVVAGQLDPAFPVPGDEFVHCCYYLWGGRSAVDQVAYLAYRQVRREQKVVDVCAEVG